MVWTVGDSIRLPYYDLPSKHISDHQIFAERPENYLYPNASQFLAAAGALLRNQSKTRSLSESVGNLFFATVEQGPCMIFCIKQCSGHKPWYLRAQLVSNTNALSINTRGVRVFGIA